MGVEEAPNAMLVILMVMLILLATYLWISGLVSSVYWYTKTRKNIRPGSGKWYQAKWYDILTFGFLAILSNPAALNEEGLSARVKTLKSLRTFFVGTALAGAVIFIDINFTHIGR